jgi:hypothetical protein
MPKSVTHVIGIKCHPQIRKDIFPHKTQQFLCVERDRRPALAVDGDDLEHPFHGRSPPLGTLLGGAGHVVHQLAVLRERIRHHPLDVHLHRRGRRGFQGRMLALGFRHAMLQLRRLAQAAGILLREREHQVVQSAAEILDAIPNESRIRLRGRGIHRGLSEEIVGGIWVRYDNTRHLTEILAGGAASVLL